MIFLGHADRNMCVSVGILLVSVKSVMNTRTNKRRSGGYNPLRLLLCIGGGKRKDGPTADFARTLGGNRYCPDLPEFDSTTNWNLNKWKDERGKCKVKEFPSEIY